MSNQLTITVCATPTSDLNLREELNLIKSALLYSDKAQLCSLKSFLILNMIGLGSLNEIQQIDFYEHVIPTLCDDEYQAQILLNFLDAYKIILRKKRPNKQEIIARLKLKKEFNSWWADLKKTLETTLTQSGAEGLIKAMDSGLLEVMVFQSDPNNTEAMTKEFIDEVINTVSSYNKYPLFDYSTGSLVQAGIKEGLIPFTEGNVSKAKHIALAANLLGRLPLFENATIDEIIDIRRELSKPLIRFRSAILKFSDNVKNAPWDEDFHYDSETVFLREIEPAILDIEEACKSNTYLDKLIKKVTDKPFLPTSSALGVALSALSNFPELAKATFGISAAVGATVIAYDATKDWLKDKESIGKNQLYFYYKAGKMLEK